MSSRKYASPLRLEINPSRILLVFLFTLHIIAACLLYFLAFDFFVSLIVVIAIVLSAVFIIPIQALKTSPRAIKKVIWDGNNEWLLETKNGKIFKAELMPDSYIHPLISILLFKPENTSLYRRFFPLSVLLLNDNIAENDFRRLRVRMKVGKPLE